MKFILLLLALSFSFAAHARDCADCAVLRNVEDRLRTLNPSDEKLRDRFIKEAAAAIGKMKPAGASGNLSKEQVHALVELQRVALPHDPGHIIIDVNAATYIKNLRAIRDRLKQLPKSEASDIDHDISIVLREVEDGNDSLGGPEEVAPKKALPKIQPR